MKKNKRSYLLPHTHWDREWRYPIWKTRSLLISFFNELLDILAADDEYTCFLMDGQVAPVLDYLEICPERRPEIERYIAGGRIAIGPWYTLPDLYPLDGECLVRNLLKGTREAEKLGGCLNVGYNSFGWGQTAQFPQIYAGFDIDFIVCAKRVNEERAPQSEFWWEAPDGTKVLTTRLGQHARANFYYNAYLPAKYGVNCMSSEFRYFPEFSGVAMHNVSPDSKDEDFFMLCPKMDFDEDKLAKGFADAWKATDATAFPNDRLFLSGTDFSTPQPQFTQMKKALEKHYPDTEFRHCRLEEYADTIKTQAENVNLRTIRGELRDGPAGDCSGNALSSRMYLKLLNKRVQNKLIHQAEPLLTAAMTAGSKYPAGLLAKAWDYLLKSHPHDSINGVTQDKTADDVEYRLNQALELAQAAIDDGMMQLAESLELSRYNGESILLLAFNPRPYEVETVQKLCIATAKPDAVWSFIACTPDGKEVPLQLISRDEKDYPVHDTQARPWPFAAHRQFMYAKLCLPAMGWQVVELKPRETFQPDHYYWIPMRRAEQDNILKAPNVLENENLRAEIESNGTICLKDKNTGKVYKNLHYFEDGGDVGNYWAYYPPYHNEVYTTLSASPRVWAEDNGPLSATIAVGYSWELPAYGSESRKGVVGKGSRSEETEKLNIISRITLHKGSKRLDINTIVDNNIKNHRLRVGFPTGIHAETADAAGHFTVDSRPNINQQAADGSYWPEMQTLPMQGFVDVSNGDNGLAILSSSTTEYEYANDEAGTLYLSLFRAMGNMIVTWWEAVGEAEGQNGSQLLRKMEFNYSIYPHKGNWAHGSVYREAEALQAEPILYQTFGGKCKGAMPPLHSCIEIDNPAIQLAALKKAEDRDSVIIRLYNPENKTHGGIIKTGFTPKRAWLCNLNEKRMEEVTLNGGTALSVNMLANKIYTFEFEV